MLRGHGSERDEAVRHPDYFGFVLSIRMSLRRACQFWLKGGTTESPSLGTVLSVGLTKVSGALFALSSRSTEPRHIGGGLNIGDFATGRVPFATSERLRGPLHIGMIRSLSRRIAFGSEGEPSCSSLASRHIGNVPTIGPVFPSCFGMSQNFAVQIALSFRSA